MTVSHARLQVLLALQGFTESRIGGHSMTYFRRDTRDGLFQKVHVDCQGKGNEAVYGNVSVSVVRYVHLKIDVRQHLTALDTNKERNWTIIKTAKQAASWERQFAEIAPVAAQAFAAEHGEELLRRTSDARQRARQYLRHADSGERIDQQIRQFEASRGVAFLRTAERLAQWPGVMQVHDADEVYLLACCAILSDAKGFVLGDQDPLQDERVMWQIQLVADGILARERSRGRGTA